LSQFLIGGLYSNEIFVSDELFLWLICKFGGVFNSLDIASVSCFIIKMLEHVVNVDAHDFSTEGEHRALLIVDSSLESRVVSELVNFNCRIISLA
jgi:hypothetical protein